MDIPIVQGVDVPSSPKKNHGTDNHNNDSSYQQVQEDGDSLTFTNPDLREAPQYQDKIWALLFWIHLAIMIPIMVLNLSADGVLEHANGSTVSYVGIVVFCGLVGVVSLVASITTLGFMITYSEGLVQTALILSVAMSGVLAVLGFMAGQTVMGIFGIIFFCIGICYAKLVWPRIPFAAANLSSALSAVHMNMGLTTVAYALTLVAFGWTILWVLSLGEAATGGNPNAGIVFLLLVSYYWVHQVLSNIVHVTTAGTIGTWWFVPTEASSCWSPAIKDSLKRATTYSFGSICLGSLLVSIVQALRSMAAMARQNDDLQMLVCIIDCILGLLQDLIEYLNMWSYVYVGLYGFSYLEAGRNVMTLFQQKGWTVIITDDLANNVLFLMSLVVGLLTGIVGWILNSTVPALLYNMDLAGSPAACSFLIGFIVGFGFCSIVMSVVGSAVNTVIVCFAESPAEFETNHPALSAKMRGAWMQAWPDLQF